MFFEDINKEYIINTETILPDFTFKSQWEQQVLYSSFQYLGNKIENYKRSYTKIQEVFASIGGFAKFFYTIIVFFYYFMQAIFRNLILMNHIEFNEDNFIDSLKQNNVEKVQMIFKNSIIEKQDVKMVNIPSIPVSQVKKNISYYNYMCYFTCNKKFKDESLREKLKKSDIYKKYFLSKLEIFSYFNLHHQLNVMKKLLLSKEHRQIMKVVKPKLKKNYEINDKSQFFNDQSKISMSGILNTPNQRLFDNKTKLLINMMEKDIQKKIGN